MIAAIEALTGLSTLWARVAATGGLVALVLSAWLAFALHYEHKGAAKAAAQIEQKAVALNEKGVKARASVADVDNAAERLRKQYCSDC